MKKLLIIQIIMAVWSFAFIPLYSMEKEASENGNENCEVFISNVPSLKNIAINTVINQARLNPQEALQEIKKRQLPLELEDYIIKSIGMNDGMSWVIPDYINTNIIGIEIPKNYYFGSKYFWGYSVSGNNKFTYYIYFYNDEIKQWNVQSLKGCSINKSNQLWSSTGRFLAVFKGEDLHIYSYSSREKKWINEPIKRGYLTPNEIFWNPSNDSFVLCTPDKDIYIYSYNDTEKSEATDQWISEKLVFDKTLDEISTIKWSPDGKFLIISDRSKTFICSFQSEKWICQSFNLKSGEIGNKCEWNPQSNSFIQKLSDGNLFIYFYNENNAWDSIELSVDTDNIIYDFYWNYYGNYIALRSFDKIYIYSYDNGKCHYKFSVDGLMPDSSFQWSSQGNLFAVSHNGVLIYSYDSLTNQWNQAQLNFNDHDDYLFSFLISPNGKYIAVMRGDSLHIYSYNIEENKWNILPPLSNDASKSIALDFAWSSSGKNCIIHGYDLDKKDPYFYLYNCESQKWLQFPLYTGKIPGNRLKFIWDSHDRYIIGQCEQGLYIWNRELFNDLSIEQLYRLKQCEHYKKINNSVDFQSLPLDLQEQYNSLPPVIKKKLNMNMSNYHWVKKYIIGGMLASCSMVLGKVIYDYIKK